MKIYIALLGLVLGLSSCSQEDDLSLQDSAQTELQIHPTIVTRSGSGGAELGSGGFSSDAVIALFAHNEINNYENKAYHLVRNRGMLAWASVDNNPITYRYKNETMNVSGYYPAVSDDQISEDGTIQIDTKEQGLPDKDLDILFADPKTMYSTTMMSQDLRFRHVMAQLRIVVKIDASSRLSLRDLQGDDTEFFFNGIKYKGTFNVKTGQVFLSDEGSIDDYTFVENASVNTDDARVFYLYVIPQFVNHMNFTIRLNNRDYNYELYPSPTPSLSSWPLDKGQTYEFEINMTSYR